MATRDNKKRCVYDLTDEEAASYDQLTELLKTSRVGMLREILKPGAIQEALVNAWKELKQDA